MLHAVAGAALGGCDGRRSAARGCGAAALAAARRALHAAPRTVPSYHHAAARRTIDAAPLAPCRTATTWTWTWTWDMDMDMDMNMGGHGLACACACAWPRPYGFQAIILYRRERGCNPICARPGCCARYWACACSLPRPGPRPPTHSEAVSGTCSRSVVVVLLLLRRRLK